MMKIGVICLGKHETLGKLIPSMKSPVIVLSGEKRRIAVGSSEYSKCNAIAIVGQDQRKILYAKEAMRAGKHVLADFPAGQSFEQIQQLQETAFRKQLCFYSPNLMRNRCGIKELRQEQDGPRSKLLSLTIVCSVPAPLDNTQLRMRMLQLLDLVKWLAGSKCTKVFGHKSRTRRFLQVCTLLISLESGVKALVNLYPDSNRTETSFWADGIFEDSIVHVDPFAQSLRVRRSGHGLGCKVGWGPSPLGLALDDFVARIKEKKWTDLDYEKHLFGLLSRVSLG